MMISASRQCSNSHSVDITCQLHQLLNLDTMLALLVRKQL